MDANSIRNANRNRQMAADLQRRQRMGMGAAGSDSAGSGAQGLAAKFANPLLAGFAPGNIGDINRAIWPFYFTFTSGDVAPGQTVVQSFTVTQEAAFIWRMATKAVFTKIDGVYSYLEPRLLERAAGLKFSVRDAQSTREFHGRVPEAIDIMGGPNFPDLNPSTVFMLPNATTQIAFSNQDALITYRPFVTFIGYRIRLEDATKILSTVTG
jgi:hypothetical protein